MENLLRRLKSPWELHRIAVLLAADVKALEAMVGLKDVLDGLSVILILPDHGEAVMELGYKLYPRFIGYMDDDLEIVRAVLKKIVSK